jgi:hypothetical protein
MEYTYIDYPQMIDNAMRHVVYQVLKDIEQEGLPGEHHFYISFRTTFPGVKVSDAVLAKFPEEMTIVLQHQYTDLRVREDHFAVTLSFGNIPERLVVPYDALVAFADPSVKFGLQFYADVDDEAVYEETSEEAVDAFMDRAPANESLEDGDMPEEKVGDDDDDADKVVTLDAFRKK